MGANNQKRTNTQFISEARSIHGDKYDYSGVVYINNRTNVSIICRIHGPFMQCPHSHINRKSNCPKCVTNEKAEILIQRKIEEKFKGLIQPDDFKIIPLTRGKFALIDNEDFDKVSSINWSVNNKGYAISGQGKKLMHRIIMNCPENMEVDHIKHDTLDNRKRNLRICTSSQNGMNSRHRKNCRSTYKGVYWNEHRQRWRSLITHNKKIIYLGVFKNEIDAAKAYDKKAIELFKEFALLNFPTK